MAKKDPTSVCDLIMKGGITSGVIYPKLIGKLSETYRFKNIGGTSAGAIAAAATAAAEFQRQAAGTDAGFNTLNELPALLGANVKTGSGDRSRLLSLFQPIPALKSHFEVLLQILNVRVPLLAALEVAFQILRRFPLPALAALILSLILPWSSLLALAGKPIAALSGALMILAAWLIVTLAVRFGFRGKIRATGELLRPAAFWLLGGVVATFGIAWAFDRVAAGPGVLSLETLALAAEMLLAGLLALAASLFVFSRSLLKGLSGNGFGFCNGLTNEQGPEALTDWLTGYFNELAGLGRSERPLSFGDLWRGSRDTAVPLPSARRRVINFEAMTSAVSRKMPYRIPFTRDEQAYYFDPEEWRRLFPESVMAAMTILGSEEAVCHPAHPDRKLYPLPPADAWPIVVSVRMSLSFPILLSAVPLYARDRAEEYWLSQTPRPAGAEAMKKVWFSDGGISSNMPLHFFDALLPKHPTFAINLTEKHPESGKGTDTPASPGYEDWRVYLPTGNNGGLHRTWKSPPTHSIGGLLGFLWSVIETMQNWRDEIQFPYPGYRDRIVQISQMPDEGGLNLNMPRETIVALSNAGDNAGGKLIEKFIAGDGWENHRKVRLRNLLAQLELKLDEFDLAAIADWQALLANMKKPPYKMSDAERQLAEDTLARLTSLAAELQNAPESLAGESAPHPFAEIRITPRV